MADFMDFVTWLGIFTFLSGVYRLFAFVWEYFLRPSVVHRYLAGPAPYAIVTGASDGIGKAVAHELYDRGFNLILHGRNEQKMKKVVDAIRATGTRDVKYFLADATRADIDFVKIAESYKDLNITLVVHNVGYNQLGFERIDERPEALLLGEIRTNALFPLLFTRALLPQLRAVRSPVLVMFTGSFSADIKVPRIPCYASSKAFLNALARCLDADERVWESSTNVRFMYLAVGTVVSNSLREKPGLFTPTSERFAKALVDRIGCEWTRVTPYWLHAVQQWGVTLMGERVVSTFAAATMKDLITKSLKGW